MLVAMTLQEHAGHSARTRHRTGTPHYLVACDETAMPELELAIASLPLCAKGRVFVEVPTPDDIGFLTVPPRMTVTWLPRSVRTGKIGTAESCRRGTAMTRAARGWAAEMLCDIDPDDERGADQNTQVWLGGDYRGVAAIHEYLTCEIGMSDAAITSREAYRLSR